MSTLELKGSKTNNNYIIVEPIGSDRSISTIVNLVMPPNWGWVSPFLKVLSVPERIKTYGHIQGTSVEVGDIVTLSADSKHSQDNLEESFHIIPLYESGFDKPFLLRWNIIDGYIKEKHFNMKTLQVNFNSIMPTGGNVFIEIHEDTDVIKEQELRVKNNIILPPRSYRDRQITGTVIATGPLAGKMFAGEDCILPGDTILMKKKASGGVLHGTKASPIAGAKMFSDKEVYRTNAHEIIAKWGVLDTGEMGWKVIGDWVAIREFCPTHRRIDNYDIGDGTLRDVFMPRDESAFLSIIPITPQTVLWDKLASYSEVVQIGSGINEEVHPRGARYGYSSLRYNEINPGDLIVHGLLRNHEDKFTFNSLEGVLNGEKVVMINSEQVNAFISKSLSYEENKAIFDTMAEDAKLRV